MALNILNKPHFGRVLPGRDIWAGDCLVCFANWSFPSYDEKEGQTLESQRSGLKISVHLPTIHFDFLDLAIAPHFENENDAYLIELLLWLYFFLKYRPCIDSTIR